MKKLVFIDVDGTLFQGNMLSITDSVKDMLLKASKEVELFIATGRCEVVLECLGDAINLFKGFVLSNGALVKYNNEIIFEEHLNKKDLKSFIDKAKAKQLKIGLISDSLVYISKFDEIIDKALTPRKKDSLVLVDDYNFNLDLKYHMIWCFDNNELIKELQNLNIDNLRYFLWGNLGCDVIINGVSKKEGIKAILNTINEEYVTYAIGDGGNDIEMFSIVDNPVAMGNAKDFVKSYAKYITLDIKEFGLEKALDNIIKGVW